MKLNYVGFAMDVSEIGTYWSAEKHDTEWPLTVVGDDLCFVNAKKGIMHVISPTSITLRTYKIAPGETPNDLIPRVAADQKARRNV